MASCLPTTGPVKCSGRAEGVLTTPDQDKERKAQEEAIMLEFLDAKGVFSRDPMDFKDKDKDRIDDRLEGGGKWRRLEQKRSAYTYESMFPGLCLRGRVGEAAGTYRNDWWPPIQSAHAHSMGRRDINSHPSPSRNLVILATTYDLILKGLYNRRLYKRSRTKNH